MSYMQEYEKWLASPALSEQEHAELESIRDDEKEIRERFYGPKRRSCALFPATRRRLRAGSLPRWSSAPPACAAPCASACTR